MIIGFIKRNRSASILVLPVALVFLWIYGFVHPATPPGDHSAPLYHILISWMAGMPYLLVILSFILVLCEALLINLIIEKNEIINTTGFLPALIYIVLMSLQPEMLSLHPILIANLFMLYAIHKLMQMHRKETAYGDVFNTGFFVSLAVLFYFPSIIFILIIWIGLLVIRPFIWREWIIAFLGFLVPWTYLIFYYFWQDKLEDLQYEVIYYTIVTPSKSFSALSFSIAEYLQFGLLVITAILSSGRVLHDMGTSTVRTRGNLLLMVNFSFLSLLSIFLAPSYSIFFLSFLSIPFTIFFSSFMLFTKKEWLAEVLFTLLIISVFVNQFLSR